MEHINEYDIEKEAPNFTNKLKFEDGFNDVHHHSINLVPRVSKLPYHEEI